MGVRSRGGGRFRRILKAIPVEERGEIVVALNLGGRRLRDAMRSSAPNRTGATGAAISYKVYPVTLRMRVGLLGRRGRKDFPFYGRIQDLGRKAQTVMVTRYRRGGRAAHLARVRAGTARASRKSPDLVVRYALHVRAMAPKRFITGKYPDLRRAIGDELRGSWSRALRRLSGGGEE